MTTVRALLDARTLGSTRRTARRRKLRLEAQGSAVSGAADVLILDISTTGLLLETAADLTTGETIELDFSDEVSTRAVVKWTSGQLFGCQFREPISSAAVSRALLRAPYETPSSATDLARPGIRDAADDVDDVGESVQEDKLTVAAKLRWILGLALLSWALVAAAVSLAWRYFH